MIHVPEEDVPHQRLADKQFLATHSSCISVHSTRTIKFRMRYGTIPEEEKTHTCVLHTHDENQGQETLRTSFGNGRGTPDSDQSERSSPRGLAIVDARGQTQGIRIFGRTPSDLPPLWPYASPFRALAPRSARLRPPPFATDSVSDLAREPRTDLMSSGKLSFGSHRPGVALSRESSC